MAVFKDGRATYVATLAEAATKPPTCLRRRLQPQKSFSKKLRRRDSKATGIVSQKKQQLKQSITQAAKQLLCRYFSTILTKEARFFVQLFLEHWIRL
jgi:hypothetical protein